MTMVYCELCGEEIKELDVPVRGLVCCKCGETLGAKMRKREEGWFMRNMSSKEFKGYVR